MGIPPPLVPDTYSRSNSSDREEPPLPGSIAFEKALSAVQTEGVMQLERNSLATPPDQRAAVLNPLIESILEQLIGLSAQSLNDICKYTMLNCSLDGCLSAQQLCTPRLRSCRCSASIYSCPENVLKTRSFSDYSNLPAGASRPLSAWSSIKACPIQLRFSSRNIWIWPHSLS